MPPPAVTIACAAEPNAVFPGEPVTVTAIANNVLHKDHVVYTWSGQEVTGTDTTGKVDTSNLAPGSYTVTCGVKEGKPGKEGLKPWESGSGAATFTVKEFEPPTISCSANPTDLKPGDSSTMTAEGVSPQNRPLTYSYQASVGTISGSGITATYSSAGAPSGPVNITCSVADDKGHNATANASLNIEQPPPPPGPSPEQLRLEVRLALHSIFFPPGQPSSEHPDDGLVTSQQQNLTTLAIDFKAYLSIKPDAHLTLTGHAGDCSTSQCNLELSQRRANVAKQFLVSQGVPANAIEVEAVGSAQELTLDQVGELVKTNTELTDQEKARVLLQMSVIQNAENRRVDITLTNTGQQSVRLYPFNAGDAQVLLGTTGTSGSASVPAVSTPSNPPAANCAGYAIFAFPARYTLDQQGVQGLSVHLVVGHSDTASTAAGIFCQDLAQEKFNCDATRISNWGSACQDSGQFTLLSLSKNGESFLVRVVPIGRLLPARVDADLTFGPGVHVDQKWPTDPYNLETDLYGDWNWKTNMEMLATGEPTSVALNLRIFDAGTKADLCCSQPFTASLYAPGPLTTVSERLWAWVKEHPTESGGALLAFLAMLIGIVKAGGIRKYARAQVDLALAKGNEPNPFWLILAAKKGTTPPAEPVPVAPPAQPPVAPPPSQPPVIVVMQQPREENPPLLDVSRSHTRLQPSRRPKHTRNDEEDGNG